MINLDKFIEDNVINRNESMFAEDISNNMAELNDRINDKTALVIGGAGSIGSAFVKELLKFKLKSLVIVDINENSLAELTRDIRSSDGLNVPEDYVTYPMSFASATFEKMFRKRNGFDIVANFSAHKHVRSEKDIFSVEALLRNNVIDAKKLMDLLCEYPPEEYFCVSTDKATNPVNIMGASKRIMEDLIFSYSDVFPVKTARFANVAFSNGSLPFGFLERIKKQQPLSAPADVRRYFVSPAESGQICMLSCILGNNRELFFPKLKEDQMMSFDVIARKLLKEYGYEAVECKTEKEAIAKALEVNEDSSEYPVFFSGSNTSGEKTFEEFYTEKETVNFDRFEALGVIEDKDIPDRAAVLSFIEDLDNELSKDEVTKERIVSLIKEYLPNFMHIETGKSLDSKM